MFFATYNTVGQSRGLASTTYYYYNDLGNVTRAVMVKENTSLAYGQFPSESAGPNGYISP